MDYGIQQMITNNDGSFEEAVVWAIEKDLMRKT